MKTENKSWMNVLQDASEFSGMLANFRDTPADEKDNPISSRKFVDGVLRGAVHDRFNLLVMRAFQCRFGNESIDDWPELLAEMVNYSTEYFYGGWRDGYQFMRARPMYDRAACRRELSWFEAYRQGTMAALLSKNETALMQLLKWPDIDLPTWHGKPEFSAEHLLSHVIIASWARTGLLCRDELFTRIMRSGLRRSRMLVDVIEVALHGDADGLARALTASIRSFKKSGFRKNRPDRWISIDDSLVCLLLRRAGVALPKLTGEFTDFLLTPEDFG